MLNDFKYKEFGENPAQQIFFVAGGEDEKFTAKEIEVYGINLNVRDDEEMK